MLLAESHLAIHTWPERRGVTLDVYVCNFTADNTGKAQELFDALMLVFRPKDRVVNRIQRGDLAAVRPPRRAAAAPGVVRSDDRRDALVFDWLNAHGYGYTPRPNSRRSSRRTSASRSTTRTSSASCSGSTAG